MTWMTFYKCPACQERHTAPAQPYSKMQIDWSDGTHLLLCPNCQEKIDLETAKNLALKQENSDVRF